MLGVSKDNLVVLLSWLYGAGKAAFPEWIIQQAIKQTSLALPEEKIGSPTYTGDVVDILEFLLGLAGSPPAGGIFHLSNSGSCIWHQWGQFCIYQAAAAGVPLKIRKISGSCLEDIVAFDAQRPINSILSTEKFTRETGIVPRSWQDAMREHFAKTVVAACR